MTAFTLDTNCIIDVDEGRPAASSIQTLLAAWAVGDADLALVASSASERQQCGMYLSNLDEFNQRLSALGFGGLPLLPSIGRWGVSFFGHGLYGSEETVEREAKIYRTLFPSSPYEWAICAEERGMCVDDRVSSAWSRWRNQILDAQALWAHQHAKRDLFVTSDQRLWLLNGHPDFPNMVIRPPEEAIAFIQVPPSGKGDATLVRMIDLHLLVFRQQAKLPETLLKTLGAISG